MRKKGTFRGIAEGDSTFSSDGRLNVSVTDFAQGQEPPNFHNVCMYFYTAHIIDSFMAVYNSSIGPSPCMNYVR